MSIFVKRRIINSLEPDRRGSVSVEMALVSVLFLFPLLFGVWDALFVLSARYQTTAALLSLYDYAWSNPNQAANISDVNAVLAVLSQTSVVPLTLPSGFAPSATYSCSQSDGSTTPATETTNQTNGTTNESCSSGSLLMNVTYEVMASISLPFPFPGLPDPTIITLSGTVQTQ